MSYDRGFSYFGRMHSNQNIYFACCFLGYKLQAPFIFCIFWLLLLYHHPPRVQSSNQRSHSFVEASVSVVLTFARVFCALSLLPGVSRRASQSAFRRRVARSWRPLFLEARARPPGWVWRDIVCCYFCDDVGAATTI